MVALVKTFLSRQRGDATKSPKDKDKKKDKGKSPMPKNDYNGSGECPSWPLFFHCPLRGLSHSLKQLALPPN